MKIEIESFEIASHETVVVQTHLTLDNGKVHSTSFTVSISKDQDVVQQLIGGLRGSAAIFERKKRLGKL